MKAKRTPQADPPRPRCATCGQPGTHFVTLEIKEMRLDRDAGVAARPYWRADYHGGSKLETVLCDGCQRNNVSIATSVSATLASVKEKP